MGSDAVQSVRYLLISCGRSFLLRWGRLRLDTCSWLTELHSVRARSSDADVWRPVVVVISDCESNSDVESSSEEAADAS